MVEDALVMQIMETKFGIDRATIQRGLKQNVYDEKMAMYMLLFNEKQQNGDAAVIKVGEHMAMRLSPP